MAQLGARFHGMEEVVSSTLTRSTKFLKDLERPLVAFVTVTGVHLESKFGRREAADQDHPWIWRELQLARKT